MSKLGHESDAITLAKEARIVRRKMFNDERYQFNGTFPSNCQNSSVPSCLKVLISMILNGSTYCFRLKEEIFFIFK